MIQKFKNHTYVDHLFVSQAVKVFALESDQTATFLSDVRPPVGMMHS